MRLTLEGATAAHGALFGDAARLRAEVIGQALARGGDRLWIEKLRLDTRPPEGAGKARAEAIDDLARVLAEAPHDAALLASLGEQLRAFADKVPAELLEAVPELAAVRRKVRCAARGGLGGSAGAPAGRRGRAMRIARLDLTRFGKFPIVRCRFLTRSVTSTWWSAPTRPASPPLRNAILDLLFGIETRSPYNFVHPYPELRLGARLEQGGTALELVRSKGRSKTLQSPSGEALADDALSPLLGGVERSFFEQMFGLSHDRLVHGGRAILDASNDVGRILFQSAAGIGSLGEIRDALDKEADSLWAPRASKQRDYYQALDAMKEAERSLKEATVRTREWDAAPAVRWRMSKPGSKPRAAVGRRSRRGGQRLDRIRRIAPQLASLRSNDAALAELGTVPPFPHDAGRLLTEARRTLVEDGPRWR